MVAFNEVLAEIQRTGVALSNHWEIHMDLPRAAYTTQVFREQIDEEIFSSQRRIAIAAEQIDVPGKLVPTQEHRIYGTRKKLPYGILMEDIQVTMRVSADMFERKFFEAWMNLIQNPATRNFNYFSEYTANIDFYQFNQNKELVYGIRLYDAYPFAMLQLNADQTAENQYYKQNVTFTYHHWESLNIRDDLYTTNKAIGSTLANPIDIIRNIISI